MTEETGLYDSTAQPETGLPKGLMTLFFSEMWERFCYYGMRVLLTLYLVKSLMKGDAEASLIYGAYTGLVYAAPILGGRMADRYLGYRYAVMLGAVLMAIGEFIILGGNETALLIGMGALIVGNGYFKANISTIVGKLYRDGDPRRDSGFTIFYIGINIGAFLATSLVAIVGEKYGFDKGFALAGIGMLLGLFIFYFGRNNYSAAEGLEFKPEGLKKVIGPINMIHVITALSLILIPLCFYLISNNDILNYIFLGLFLYIAYSLITAGIKEDKTTGQKVWKDRMIALIIFMIINVVFWACFEQAGTSLTLFADRNVDRVFWGWEMPASMTQVFNPLFIIGFGSLFSMMWVKLSKANRNPSIPLKFALGIFQLGLGFLVTYLGYLFAEDNLVPLITLVFLYMLHTTGELFLSPIGLSMVTKLSPKQMAGTAMGAWFLSFAIANLLGGQIAALTGSGHGNKAESTGTFTFETTIEEALKSVNRETDFESWKPIGTSSDKDYDQPKNISFQQYLIVRDWVEMRLSLSKDESFLTWKELRSNLDTAKTAEAWLHSSNWDDISKNYQALEKIDVTLIESGKDDEIPGFSWKDWSYYRSGIDTLNFASDLPLAQALSIQKDTVQEARLEKYVSIFTTIGLVLLAFALLIVFINKPLQKLMHGVS